MDGRGQMLRVSASTVSVGNLLIDWLTSIAARLRYDVALLYLKNAEWNLDEAVQAYQEDEQWEKEHPLHKDDKRAKAPKKPKDVGMRRFVGSSSR
jgi:hypothetical protein